jgi:hypothetical protein
MINRNRSSKSLPNSGSKVSTRRFHPPGIEVVTWYVMMGIGQVVTLRVPAERLREVNRAIEQTAWGGFRTEFYPTYDLKAVAEELHAKGQ